MSPTVELTLKTAASNSSFRRMLRISGLDFTLGEECVVVHGTLAGVAVVITYNAKACKGHVSPVRT